MSLIQIAELIIGCIAVNMLVYAMQSDKSKLYKSISACTYLSFLILIASVFSQLTATFITIIKICSICVWLISLIMLHIIKKHSKKMLKNNSKQLVQNIMRIHNNDNNEFSMQDAEKLKQSVMRNNNADEQRIAHHILMQNEKYHKHFMISIKVLSHCVNMSENDIKKAIRDAFHNHPNALNAINLKIQKYDSLHPSNTFVDRINKAEQNNNSND